VFPIEAFQSTLEKLTVILRRYQVPFHLTGGVTSVAYAEPRMTQDIDVVVENAIFSANIQEILADFSKSDFMFDEPSIRSAVANHKMFQLLDVAESLKLDIYPRELIEGELKRSVTIELFEGAHYPIASRVDTAIAKLLWVEQGSHKSRRDLRQLYRNASTEEQHEIDRIAKDMVKHVLLTAVLAEQDEVDL
jgi:hypothetical protein